MFSAPSSLHTHCGMPDGVSASNLMRILYLNSCMQISFTTTIFFGLLCFVFDLDTLQHVTYSSSGRQHNPTLFTMSILKTSNLCDIQHSFTVRKLPDLVAQCVPFGTSNYIKFHFPYRPRNKKKCEMMLSNI
jgi:hypothetical protein